MPTTFLLSPARLDGRRAALLFHPQADFPLAQRLRAGKVPLGEVFSFLSGLYFRGKYAYAAHFGTALVITSNRGLLPAQEPVGLGELSRFSRVPIDPADPRYRGPLEASLAAAAAQAGTETSFVLLGSLATDKYTGILRAALGARLLFPPAFLGRGDMSRGALLLRQAALSEELEYASIAALPPQAKAPAPRAVPVQNAAVRGGRRLRRAI
ncbi:MAG: hypothetical protein PW734_02725 [Verrucomicrobium sp.]|nr:hypothetical protein [Verrucomicrobium sp.]